MSGLNHARILPLAVGEPTKPLGSDFESAPDVAPAWRVRILREELAATERAAAILADAERAASELLARSVRDAQIAIEKAAADAAESERARLSAAFIAMHVREETLQERELDRTIALAVILAERLIGASIAQRPDQIVSLAKRALAEARAARAIVIDAHPVDGAELARHIADLGAPSGTVTIREDSALARGHICLHTDLGMLDAKLEPQLERLAAALRDALQRA